MSHRQSSKSDDARDAAAASLTAYLLGDWMLRRTVRDRIGATDHVMTGSARVFRQGAWLRHDERIAWTVGGQSFDAFRRYDLVPRAAWQADVFFEDGRPFYKLDIASGIAHLAHDCAPDVYTGWLRIDGADQYILSWTVQGPRKDMTLSTVFNRT